MGITDRFYYKILAMAVNKKIIVDQNAMDLLQYFEAVGLTHVKDISALGLDPQKTADDIQQIHKRLKKSAKATPNSNYLFLTRNGKDFPSPDGYDVVWLPSTYNAKDFSEAFKAWVVFTPKKSANVVYQVKKTNSKYSNRFEFAIKK